jgi:hypothetical protein
MLRNINDNFISVSFDHAGNIIQIKVILEKRTYVEDTYIDDMITEFSALQEFDCVNKPLVQVGSQHKPLRNLVYQKITS